MKSEIFLERILHLLPYNKFLIAYSGGLDSHVLLHLMAQLRVDHPEIELAAIHVNHGLSSNAASWVIHCQKICKELNIPLILKAFSLKKMPNKSLEAEARKLRYKIFAEELPEDTCLLTAHHQNDQAETLLLQLFRGAGPKGLAAMPEKMLFKNSFLFRPLLNFSRAELHKYAEEKKLQWLDDESNFNLNFDRNFLRHELIPLVQKRWPSVQGALARGARHCGEASELLSELAAIDLYSIGGFATRWKKGISSRDHNSRDLSVNTSTDSSVQENNQHKLNISALLQLPPARQRNLLREWLRQLNFPIPSENKILQIQNEIITARADAKPLLKWEATEIRRYKNYLYVIKPLSVMDFNWQEIWDLNHTSTNLSFSSSLLLPNNLGLLIAEKKQGAGYLKLPPKAKVTVRFRREGERCQPALRLGSHPLKKLMQEWQIPPWQRDRIPLIYFNDHLVAVVGYCVCEGYVTKDNEEGVEITC